MKNAVKREKHCRRGEGCIGGGEGRGVWGGLYVVVFVFFAVYLYLCGGARQQRFTLNLLYFEESFFVPGGKKRVRRSVLCVVCVCVGGGGGQQYGSLVNQGVGVDHEGSIAKSGGGGGYFVQLRSETSAHSARGCTPVGVRPKNRKRERRRWGRGRERETTGAPSESKRRIRGTVRSRLRLSRKKWKKGGGKNRACDSHAPRRRK